MADAILVLNSGSSSLKFSIFLAGGDDSAPLACGQVEGIGASARFVLKGANGSILETQDLTEDPPFDHEKALGLVLERCRVHFSEHRVVAVGHRVVHGGVKFAEPVLVTPQVLQALDELVPLAPLHQPHNLSPIRAVSRRIPQLPQVACFDTAFHRTQPEVAQQFGLPRQLTEEGIRRYGFHGLSYEFIASVLPKIDPSATKGKTVVAHLGNGASMCALLSSRSVATTMSFTPTDGLIMGTRVGNIDPGVLLYLMAQKGMGARELEKLIYHESGLLGVSGLSSDMRMLLNSNDPHAAESIDLFVYRIIRELGSLVAALGGLDTLVFTGGIGENSPIIRERICRDAKWLDLILDSSANSAGASRISSSESRVAVWVIPTNEEWMIANHTRQLLAIR
jgi:acetate kinase